MYGRFRKQIQNERFSGKVGTGRSIRTCHYQIEDVQKVEVKMGILEQAYVCNNV